MGTELISNLNTSRRRQAEPTVLQLGSAPIERVIPPGAWRGRTTAKTPPGPSEFFPHEFQQRLAGQRMCGAAALAMTIRSLGQTARQEELWPEIRIRDGKGHYSARTHRLAKAALRRGFDAAIVQVRSPQESLPDMLRDGSRLILNHLLARGSTWGHYSLLVGADKHGVQLHDPLFGPHRSLSWNDMNDLWIQVASVCSTEITGNVLVCVGRQNTKRVVCSTCNSEIPNAVPCGACGNSISLRPATAFGCLHAGCPQRRWVKFYCTECDAAHGPGK